MEVFKGFSWTCTIHSSQLVDPNSWTWEVSFCTSLTKPARVLWGRNTLWHPSKPFFNSPMLKKSFETTFGAGKLPGVVPSTLLKVTQVWSLTRLVKLSNAKAMVKSYDALLNHVDTKSIDSCNCNYNGVKMRENTGRLSEWFRVACEGDELSARCPKKNPGKWSRNLCGNSFWVHMEVYLCTNTFENLCKTGVDHSLSCIACSDMQYPSPFLKAKKNVVSFEIFEPQLFLSKIPSSKSPDSLESGIPMNKIL